MKLTEKLEKIGNKATKQWLAVAAAFILVFPAAGVFGTGNMPVAGSPASGQEKAENTDITQAGKNTGDSLSEDQQEITGTEEIIEEPSDSLQTKYEAMSQDQKQL